MKANELMLDDWVECLDSTHKERVYAQIDAIEESRRCLLVKDGWSNWFLDISHLEPIPLTEDILVKNGFEKQGDLYQYHINAGDGYTRIDIIDLQDGVWSYDIDVYDKFADAHKIHHDDDCFLKLHQLQHLLRLCGIKKTIEL